jgi:cytochrome P450
MYHLAVHPANRQRLLAEPELWRSAIEAFLRYYSSVAHGAGHSTYQRNGDIGYLRQRLAR